MIRRLFVLIFIALTSGCSAEPAQVAVIGSGPAGLGAGYVTASKGFDTIIFSGDPRLGNLSHKKAVKNWLGVDPTTSGPEIMEQVEKQVLDAGARIYPDMVKTVDLSTSPFLITTESGMQIEAQSVIIATGSGTKKLEVPGASYTVVDVSKKDTSWHGKQVVVVGSGDDAVSKAAFFAEHASRVFLLVRGTELKTTKHGIEELKPFVDKLEIRYSTQVEEVIVHDEKVSAVQTNEGEIPCDLIVVAIGNKANSELVQPYLTCKEDGSIIVKPDSHQTSLDGVFAAGTVIADKPYGQKQAIISAAEGMMAGYEAVAFLKNAKGKNGTTQ